MAEESKFSAGFTKQVLVDYAANSLAPYTVLECITEVSNSNTGMQLIYEHINKDLLDTTSTAITGISTGQYLVVWDNTASSTQNVGKFKALKIVSDSGSSAGTGEAAESVFGQDGQFHGRVKYAENLYSSDTNFRKSSVLANGTNFWIPVVVDSGQGQNTYYTMPDSITDYNQALICDKNGNITWGAAGAILKNDRDNTTSLHYLIGAIDNNNTLNNAAPAELYYDDRIYFKNGSLYHASDETLKTFTSNIDINFDNLATIKKGFFYWKEDPDKILNLGVTAQSVEDLYPEIVTTNMGFKSVDYSKLSVIALAAIDKLHERITELENQVEQLKKSKD